MAAPPAPPSSGGHAGMPGASSRLGDVAVHGDVVSPSSDEDPAWSGLRRRPQLVADQAVDQAGDWPVELRHCHPALDEALGGTELELGRRGVADIRAREHDEREGGEVVVAAEARHDRAAVAVGQQDIEHEEVRTRRPASIAGGTVSAWNVARPWCSTMAVSPWARAGSSSTTSTLATAAPVDRAGSGTAKRSGSPTGLVVRGRRRHVGWPWIFSRWRGVVMPGLLSDGLTGSSGKSGYRAR